MAEISPRIERRAHADFPRDAHVVVAALTDLAKDVFPDEARDSPAVERVQAAALVVAEGDLRRLDDALDTGRRDWRDLLVFGGLADGDWRDRVAAELDAP